MLEHLSEPFLVSKQLNKVARYVSKLYPELDLMEWWNTEPCLSQVSYRITYEHLTIGGLYQDTHTDDVFLALNIGIQFNDYEYELQNKIELIGCDLVVKWLECVPILSLKNIHLSDLIIFKITRENIPNV